MLRILILLLVLLVVALTTWMDGYRSTRWREPLYVALYPIAADDSAVTSQYVAALDTDRFQPIDVFFRREAERYELREPQPVKMRLRPQLRDQPPRRAPDAGILATALWSLKLRFWAWRASGHVNEPEDIRIFVLYHDPALTPSVPHSLGLTKGLIGVVYAFAAPEMNGENDVVIAGAQSDAALSTAQRRGDGRTADAQCRPLATGGKSRRSGDRPGYGAGNTLAGCTLITSGPAPSD
jgi:hypothetical protein